MNEHDLQWLIVQLRMYLAYLASESEGLGGNESTRKAAWKLLDLDSSNAANYEFDFQRVRELQKQWNIEGNADKLESLAKKWYA